MRERRSRTNDSACGCAYPYDRGRGHASYVDGQPTATPVSGAMADLTWMQRYLESPGYDSEWGEPKTGGTFIFGAQRDNTRFNLYIQACCYTHGCWRGLPVNSLSA